MASSNLRLRRVPLAKKLVAAIVLALMTAFQVAPTNAEVAGERARRVVDSAIDLLRKTTGSSKLHVASQVASTPIERAALITHFRLCPRNLTLYVGEDYTLVPVALDQSGQIVHCVAYAWQTSNALVASVSGGTVEAIAPGLAAVTVSIGTAIATVSVVVLPGARPRLTDAQWDLQHANDCVNPESVAVTDTDLKIAEANQMRVAERSEFDDQRGAAGPSELVRLAKPAVMRRATSGRPIAGRAAKAPLGRREETADPEPLAPQGGPAPIDGDGGDPTVTQATAYFSNAIGTPRFSPRLAAMGSALKTKNNLGSYNYSFTASVVSLPGRGIDLNLAMIYNSRVWSLDNGTMIFNYNKGWPAAGWSLGYGRLIDNYDHTGTGDLSGIGFANAPGNYFLLQPDGTRVHLQQSYDSTSGHWTNNSTDGSFVTLNPYNGKLRYPDGTLVDFDVKNNRWLPAKIQSANGQQITIAYKKYCKNVDPTIGCNDVFPFRWAIDSIRDTAGRYVTFNYDPTTHYLTSITAPDQGSGTRTLVQISYQTITLQYNFDPSVTVDPNMNPHSGDQLDVVRRIYYPQTGRGYLFPDYSSYGIARKISMRIGMTTSSDGTEVAYTTYNYTTINSTDPTDPPYGRNQVGQLNDSPQYTTRSEWWQDKADSSGSPTTATTDYTYSRSAGTDANGFAVELDTVQNSDSNLKIVTTTGDDSVNVPDYFGHVTSTEYKDLSDHSLQKTSYEYLTGPDGGTQLGSVSTVVDGGQPSKATYSYGNYGRVSTMDEYGFSSSIQRRTSFSYLGGAAYVGDAHLVRLVNNVTVYDGANLTTPLARTDFTYDDYASSGGMISPTPLPPGYDPGYTSSVTNRGNVTAVTTWVDPVNGPSITRYTQFDIFGNVRRQDVSCCKSKSFSFSDTTTHYSQPDSVTDGTPNVVPFLTTSFVYDGLNTGLLLSTTDPQNRTTSFTYDNAWRLKIVTPPQSTFSTTTDFDKDANDHDLLAYSQKVSYTDVDGQAKTITTKSWFDGAGRTIRAGSGEGSTPTSFDAVKTLYDPVGRVVKQSNPYSGDSSGNGSPSYWTKNVYDPLSRVTEVDLPDDNPSGQRSRILTAYSSAVVTVTDQVGRKRQSEVDGLGRLIKVTEMNPATGLLDATNYLTTYSYNTLDNLTGVNQGGQTRSFSYDALSRMTSQTTPEGGTVNLTYTDFNAVLKRTDARNVETHYKYDTLNRLTQVWYTGLGGDDAGTVRPALPSGVAATSDVIIAYNNLSSAGSGNGEVNRIDDGGGFESYSYDSLSRISSKTRTIDGVNAYTTGYQYNAINQLSVITYPSNKQVRQNHDSRGRLSRIDKLSGGVFVSSYLSGVAYSTAGQVTGMTDGSGVAESYSYSADRLQLTRQTATKNATTLMDLNYSYAAVAGGSGVGTTAGNSGQLMSITNNPNNQPSTINGQARNENYSYDDLARLVSASGYYLQRNYAYDQWANRTSVGGGSTQSVIMQEPGGVTNNRIATVNGTAYSYDAAGNVTNDGTHSYQYDAAGRIAAADNATASYTYDYANQRVKKLVGGTTTYYVWEGGKVIAEYSNATSGAGGVKYYLTDRLSTRMVTDSNGAVIATQDHLPFGEESGTSSGQIEKHRFTNYERDSESGTDYAVNRQYSTGTARFTRPDPVGGLFTAPQSFNRYAYAMNDPVNLVDPQGLYEPCVHEAMTRYLARLAGLPKTTAHQLGRYAGDKPGGADSPEFAVNKPSFLEPAEKWAIHFPTEEQLNGFKSTFWGKLNSGTEQGMQKAGHTLHSIEDAHGAHKGYIGNPFGHAPSHTPDRIIGDQKFWDVSNEVLQFLKKDSNVTLTNQQMNELIDAIENECKGKPFKLQITRPTGGGGGGGGQFYGFGWGVPSWYYSMWDFLDWVDSIGEGTVTSSYELEPPEDLEN